MKWYQKTGWIAVFLILFFPLGCFLMWKYRPQWSNWIKWPVSIILGIWFLSIAAQSLTPAGISNTAQLSETQALLEQRESELAEAKTLLEESQQTLTLTQEELTDTQDKLAQTQEELAEVQEQLAQTQDELADTQDKLKQAESTPEEAQNSPSRTGSSDTQASDSAPDSSSSASADSGITNSQTVLVTRTGSKYHNHKCGNGTYYEATLDEALARGLTPCEKCY